MALFEYFPNYIWNLSLAIALESGAVIGEIMDIVEPVKDAANDGPDKGTQVFMAQWNAKAETLIELSAEDEARGRTFSAGALLTTWMMCESVIRLPMPNCWMSSGRNSRPTTSTFGHLFETSVCQEHTSCLPWLIPQTNQILEILPAPNCVA